MVRRKSLLSDETFKEILSLHGLAESRADLIFFLGGKCALCHKPYPDGKSWTIHHRNYREGEKTSNDFKERIPHVITRGKRKGKKTFKTMYRKQEYYEYLKPVVLGRSDPRKDFAPLHNSCHQAVSRLARWKKPNRKRLCRLALEQD